MSPICTFFPISFFICLCIIIPAIAFGTKSLNARNSAISITAPDIIAIVVITIFVSPNCCNTIVSVARYIAYSAILASASLSGLNPAATSILFISASVSTLLIILPASLAIVSPISIVITAIAIFVDMLCSVVISSMYCTFHVVWL